MDPRFEFRYHSIFFQIIIPLFIDPFFSQEEKSEVIVVFHPIFYMPYDHYLVPYQGVAC